MAHGHDVRRVFLPLRGRTVRGGMRLLAALLFACHVSSCSLYSEGRAFFEAPMESIECWTECPWATASVTLRHRDTGATVTCGPYPHALYASMAATYRLERQQCLRRYQQQGYVRLVSSEDERAP